MRLSICAVMEGRRLKRTNGELWHYNALESFGVDLCSCTTA
jgi:hypothetical protein